MTQQSTKLSPQPTQEIPQHPEDIHYLDLVIYNHHKYFPINGSLFYGIEYAQLANTVYIVLIPASKDKKRLEEQYYQLWSQKYKEEIASDMMTRTKFLTDIELLKIIRPKASQTTKIRNVLMICSNVVFDTCLNAVSLYDNFMSVKIIQNRKVKALKPTDRRTLEQLSALDNVELLFERPEQDDSSFINKRKYKLKLGTPLFKKLFKDVVKNDQPDPEFIRNSKNPKTTKAKLKYYSILYSKHPLPTVIHSGFIPQSYLPKTDKEIQKPSHPCQVQPKWNFFDSVNKVVYYRNAMLFDENNRIIVEADWYDIPVEIKEVSVGSSNSKDSLNSTDYQDSTHDRHLNPTLYHLTELDYVLLWFSCDSEDNQ